MYTPHLGFKKVYTPYIGQAHTLLNYEVLRHPHLYSMLVHTYTHSYIPYGVFEAVVGGSREDKVCSSQLLNVAEPLELRGVDDTDQQRMHLYMAMDGVIKHLQETIIHVIADTLTDSTNSLPLSLSGIDGGTYCHDCLDQVRLQETTTVQIISQPQRELWV